MKGGNPHGARWIGDDVKDLAREVAELKRRVSNLEARGAVREEAPPPRSSMDVPFDGKKE